MTMQDKYEKAPRKGQKITNITNHEDWLHSGNGNKTQIL